MRLIRRSYATTPDSSQFFSHGVKVGKLVSISDWTVRHLFSHLNFLPLSRIRGASYMLWNRLQATEKYSMPHAAQGGAQASSASASASASACSLLQLLCALFLLSECLHLLSTWQVLSRRQILAGAVGMAATVWLYDFLYEWHNDRQLADRLRARTHAEPSQQPSTRRQEP